MSMCKSYFFFFSSRRRHTRWNCDWSSDVCSSDLGAGVCVLAGELYAETLPGFVHPAPLALIEHGVKGRTVVYSTTNGTVAMTLAAGARRVYCGALLNAAHLVEHIAREH